VIAAAGGGRNHARLAARTVQCLAAERCGASWPNRAGLATDGAARCGRTAQASRPNGAARRSRTAHWIAAELRHVRRRARCSLRTMFRPPADMFA